MMHPESVKSKSGFYLLRVTPVKQEATIYVSLDIQRELRVESWKEPAKVVWASD